MTMLMLILSTTALAVQVQGLFDVQRLVPDQSEETRADVIKDALAEIVVRTTGHSTSLENEQVQKIIATANRYLSQFSYADNPLVGLDATANENTTEQAPLKYRLNMRFDENSLLQALGQSQQPIWGNNRPSTLIWLAIEGSNGRFIVNSENNPLLSDIIQTQATRRGLPATLPLIDLEDEQRISVSDIWGQFSDRIKAASLRYASDATMTGRVYRATAEHWHARWVLQIGNQQLMTDLESEQLRDLLVLSMDWLAESLANKYAVTASTSGPDSYRFKVLGIESIADYARLNAYLGGLQIVESVEILEFDKGTLQYQVKIKGAASQFLSVLALESYLQADRAEQVIPTFYWRHR
ncbi:hypothetical protein BTE48_06845 [Oceanospirillum multiglobuliferum]|uniref:DUF2066 domain-containing protein n=2 Tax=Oceanospirillum multiglobuliferum TaxID=64969 RepID=A0A1V4T7H8_9GAMM|nr:hypothetical protein BTE48_06845 [Oceanospirillum multiglobuliferum]